MLRSSFSSVSGADLNTQQHSSQTCVWSRSEHTAAQLSDVCVEMRRTMLFNTVFIFCLLVGVFGADTERTEAVSVMAGGSVTLHTDIGAIKKNDDIVWKFGPDSPDTLISEIIKWSYMFSVRVHEREQFRDRLQLDHGTGALTITNVSAEHSGIYTFTIIRDRKTSRKRFNVKVYGPLPVPSISSVSQNSSASRSSAPACALLCSVDNVTWVTLSLYNGSDLVSSVRGSDARSSLSIPLEMQHHDENTYSCVANDPFRNQTSLLNVTELCRPPSDDSLLYTLLLLLLLLLLIPIALAVAALMLCVRRRRREEKQEHENCYREE